MITRPIWLARLDRAWTRAPIAWLSGVRRSGKTTLATAFGEADYLNCDLPSTAARLANPESFFGAVRAPIVVLDEVHQLQDPSLVLKIGADSRPDLRILATGSSTLAATRKFRDALTGRKRHVHLTPVLAEESHAFGVTSIEERLLRGGLPPVLLQAGPDPEFYAEWLDSYYSRDVQELFRVGKRAEFLRLVELLLRQSGGLLETTSLAKAVGLSRPTVGSYLDVLRATHVVHVLRPFHAGARRELLAQPKVYGFDTGFVAHVRGWLDLRPEDCGKLWEHLVLDTLLALPDVAPIQFWRDRSAHEVDFVIPRGRGVCDAIECKWNADAWESRSLAVFRAAHPGGRNYVVAPHVPNPHVVHRGGLAVDVLDATTLRARLLANAAT
jgi:hypothetical protein